MRKIFFVLVAAALTFSNLNANAAYNPTKPVVSQCSATPTIIPEAGGQLQVTLHIVDPTPVNYVVVNVMNSSADSIAFGSLSLTGGSATDGDWSKTFTIKPDLKPGIYSVVAQTVMDTSNNSISFYTCPNSKIIYGNVTVQNPQPVPSATPKSSATPKPSLPVQSAQDLDLNYLKSQIASLQTQLRTIEAKMKKICAVKPKPKGC